MPRSNVPTMPATVADLTPAQARVLPWLLGGHRLSAEGSERRWTANGGEPHGVSASLATMRVLERRGVVEEDPTYPVLAFRITAAAQAQYRPMPVEDDDEIG